MIIAAIIAFVTSLIVNVVMYRLRIGAQHRARLRTEPARCRHLVAKSGAYEALCPMPVGHVGDHALTTGQMGACGYAKPPF